MRIKYKIATLFLVLSLSACAQEPSSVVSPDQIAGGSSALEQETDIISKNAINYSGTDFFGSSCGLDLSIIEENGNHLFLVKVNYLLHGTVLPVTESSMFRFDLAANSYNDPDTEAGLLTLGAALLNNGTEADMNLLSTYESQGLLEYSVRVETNATSAIDFEEALEEVVVDPAALNLYKMELDLIERIVFKIAHAGHYDASGCIGMKLSGVSQVDFEIGEHDDHDHDDGDHDHDHD